MFIHIFFIISWPKYVFSKSGLHWSLISVITCTMKDIQDIVERFVRMIKIILLIKEQILQRNSPTGIRFWHHFHTVKLNVMHRLFVNFSQEYLSQTRTMLVWFYVDFHNHSALLTLKFTLSISSPAEASVRVQPDGLCHWEGRREGHHWYGEHSGHPAYGHSWAMSSYHGLYRGCRWLLGHSPEILQLRDDLMMDKFAMAYFPE